MAPTESCHSRSLSWLVKSCIPKPDSDIFHPHHKIRPGPVPEPESESSPISSLPDDLLLECLSRVPLSSLPSLPSVSRRFSLLLVDPTFSLLRRSLSLLHPALISLSFSDDQIISSVHPILHNAPDGATWSLSPPPHPIGTSRPSLVPVGRHVYVLGSRSALLLDTWTLRSSPIPPTLFPRKKFAAATVNGRIYVAGGSSRTSALETYDPDSATWRVAPGPAPLRRHACFGAAAGDLFFVVGGLTFSSDPPSSRAAHASSAGTMDAYHVRMGAWVLRGTRAVPGGGCAVGACGVGPHVYVVASNALEFSFWRWSWEEEKRYVGGWTRLEPPPVPGMAGGLGGAVRFGCSALGESRMVAVVHVSSRGRGRGNVEVGSMDGAVLIYDVDSGEWARGPDLPVGVRRGVCFCVDC